MHFKSIFVILILSVIATDNVQGIGLLKAKIGLLKAKTVAVAAPHVAAKIAVAKEVKAKTAIAFAKSVAAVKASKSAAFAALTAPIKVAKKTIALKVAGVTAAKALKVAKVAHVVGSLKKPILIPVGIPFPVPYKVPLPIPYKSPIATLGAGALGFNAGLKAGSAAGAGAGLLGAGLGSAGAATGASGLFGGALASLTNPVQGLIDGATSVLRSAGSLPLPFLSTLTNGVASQTTVSDQYGVPEARQEPVYQFVPSAGFSNYNRVHYSPSVRVDLPTNNPHTSYEVPHTSYEVPHTSYEVPRTSYELPNQYGAPHH